MPTLSSELGPWRAEPVRAATMAVPQRKASEDVFKAAWDSLIGKRLGALTGAPQDPRHGRSRCTRS
jgi:hypothetical protein